MQLNDVYFLPADDPSGWTVAGIVNTGRPQPLRLVRHRDPARHQARRTRFRVSHLRRARPATTFSSASAAPTAPASPSTCEEMDYFVSSDARLGGTTDKWISLGTHSRNRDYYELLPVQSLTTPKMYAVNHVVRDADSGNSPAHGPRDRPEGRVALRGVRGLAGPHCRPHAGPRLLQLQGHHARGRKLRRREAPHPLQRRPHPAPWSIRPTSSPSRTTSA